MPSRTANHVAPSTPTGFADGERDEDAQRHGAFARFREGVGREDDAGVGQREEGQDEEAHPGVDHSLDALHGPLGAAAEPLNLLHNRLRLFLVAVLHCQSGSP